MTEYAVDVVHALETEEQSCRLVNWFKYELVKVGLIHRYRCVTTPTAPPSGQLWSTADSGGHNISNVGHSCVCVCVCATIRGRAAEPREAEHR